MRSRLALPLLCVYLALVIGCNKPPSDNTAPAATDSQPAASPDNSTAKESSEHKEHAEHRAEKKEPLVVPTGTAITISLGSAVGSKVSKAGDNFTGSVAKEVRAG